MIRLRKGELNFYKKMNPTELSEYVKDFPENTDYVIVFLNKHEYNWVKKEWYKGKTI